MTTYDQTGVTYDAAAYTYNGDAYSPSVFPVAGVYIAFTDGPYEAFPAWTEVTTYVRGITVHRGRGSDFDQFDTGTAQLVLDNRDRTFDPFYESGPHFGNLLPRRQIRIVGQIGGSTYDVFRGFVAGWPVAWTNAAYDSTVTIQCFDALGLMANEQVPTDWPGYYTQSLSPRHYWKCNDSRTTAKAVDIPGAGVTALPLLPTTSNTFPFEVPPAADGLVGNGLNFYTCPMANPSGFPASTSTAVSDLTLTFWATFQSVAGAVATVAYSYFGSYVSLVWNYTGGTFAVIVRNATRQVTYTFTPPPQNVGIHYAIVITPNAGGDPSAVVYENAVVKTPSSSSAVGVGGLGYEQIIVSQISLQEIAVFPSLLTSTQVAQIFNAGAARFSETTSARMGRLLDTTEWPPTLEAFPASPVGTVAEIGSGTGVIPELQLVADSEGGELYVSKTGVLTMTARRDVFNATRSATPQATLSMAGDPGVNYGTDLQIQYDADNLKNDITVNYSGDGQVNTANDVTIAAYGAASTIIETQLDSPTSAADLALLELGVEGVLVPQISPLDVSPNTDPADWQTILGLELLDRVTFQFAPPVGAAFQRDALINAIDHQIEPGVWRTQLTLSMRYTSPLTLDDPVLGRLDYNYLG